MHVYMEESIFTVLEQTLIVIAVASAFVTPLVAYFRKKFRCISEVKDIQDDQKQRSLRQSKALIVLANRIDDINFNQHPEKGKLNLGPEIETILKDERGHL